MQHPLASQRINRASAKINKYIEDLVLAANQDNVGHAIGQASEVYKTTVAKLAKPLMQYLYMGWTEKERAMVMSDE